MTDLQKLRKQIQKLLERAKKRVKKYKTLEEDMRLAILPLILIIVLLSLLTYDNYLKRDISSYAFGEVSSQIPLKPFPILSNSVNPAISADAAIILDDTTKTQLFVKNPEFRYSMASTTKVMTALTALNHFRLSDVLTVKTATVEGTLVGLYPGEQVTFEDLLYGMMLPSGNDAAYVIADNYPGGVKAFVEKMNENARTFRMYNTNYGDPAGLLDDQDYTTVTDLALLASVAVNNPTLKRIMSTKQKVITTLNTSRTIPIENLNKLLGTQGVNGIKTGFTERAGGVLMTSTIQNGHLFIIIVMKSLDRFYDTQVLLGVIADQVTFFTPNLQTLPLQ